MTKDYFLKNYIVFFFFKQKTAYEIKECDWSSDVCLPIYPVGSLVYLNTGEIGIVVAGNYGHPTRSIVRILLTTNQEVDQSNKYCDLLKDTMVYVNGCVPIAEEEEILRVLKPRGTIEPHMYV